MVGYRNINILNGNAPVGTNNRFPVEDAYTKGFGIPEYDYIELVYSGSILDKVNYRLGGASGTIVATLTIIYSGGTTVGVSRT